MKIQFTELKKRLLEILIKHSFSDQEARQIALIFTENTFDGVFSHGINRFPRFIRDVKEEVVIPGMLPVLKNGMNAFEQWDGKGGAGISNALFCSDRSMELASSFGIGCVGLRNANHWMRGGTYGWKAAEKGFIFIAWTNTLPNMPPWGGSTAAIGNNPFVMAIPHTEGPIVLDMAMSQFAFGKLEWHVKNGTNLPEFGGYDRNNELTKNPVEILETSRILPTGLWKGSAMSLVLDLAAAILSGGNTTFNIGKLPVETSLSQIFISLESGRYMSQVQRDSLVRETMEFIVSRNKNARYPGQRAKQTRLFHQEHGIDIPDLIWTEIMNL